MFLPTISRFKLFLLNSVFFSTRLFAKETQQSSTPVESIMPMFLGLIAILGVIFLLAFLFKKFTNFGLSGKYIRVIETQIIGSKEKLMIIQVQEQQFLIGVTSHTINQLGELKNIIVNPEHKTIVNETADRSQTDNSFSQIISRLINPPKQASFLQKNKSTAHFKDKQI